LSLAIKQHERFAVSLGDTLERAPENGFLFVGKQVIVDPLANNFNLISSGHTIPFASLALVLLCVAMGVSAMGSGLTLRRFLKI